MQLLSRGSTLVLRANEAHSTLSVLLRQQVSLTIPQFLVGHQGIITVTHSHIRLQVGQLLSHLCLLSLQKFWEKE